MDLIVFPELWTVGYGNERNMLSQTEEYNGPSFIRLSKLAKERHIAIAYGYAEKINGEERFRLFFTNFLPVSANVITLP